MYILNAYLFILLPLNVFGAKLNTPIILLPVNSQGHSISYILEIHETTAECFKWSSLREDVISVKPNSADGCSDSAVVTVLTRQASTHKVIVLAEDKGGGAVLRCDVIVDTPASLSIATTTREVYVEEAAELFELVAHDVEGNQFSSLSGLAFEWTVENTNGQSVVEIMPFTESDYDSTSAVLSLEKRGLRGDKVLLVGVTTGRADVSARLTSTTSGQVLVAPSVTLTCVANLLLLPAEAHTLPGTQVSYSVVQVKHGRLHAIDLLSSPYFLSVRDGNVGAVSRASGEVDCLKFGSTEVVLRDSNMADNSTGATARLHVTDVARITLVAPPGDHWLHVLGSPLSIQCHAWDAHGHRLIIGSNLKIDISVSSEYFRGDFRVDNGSYIEGVGIKLGKVPVKAILSSYRGADGTNHQLKRPLTASSVLELCAPLAVRPPVVVLPWSPLARELNEFQLHYEGGDDLVTWSVSNNQLVTVDQHGLLRSRGLGHVNVTVALQRNPLITASAQVYVVMAETLRFLAGVRECSLSDTLYLPVAVQGRLPGGHLADLTRCDSVGLTVSTDSERYSAELAGTGEGGDLPSGACLFVAVTGSKLGHTQVTLQLNPASSSPPNTVGGLSTSTGSSSCVVGFFRSLQLKLRPDQLEGHDHRQQQQSLLLAPDSWWGVLLVEGPLPWPSDPTLFRTQVISSDPSRVLAVRHETPAGSIVRLQCQQLTAVNSDVTVSITVGNSRHDQLLPSPVTSTARVNVRCALPELLQLSVGTPPFSGDTSNHHGPLSLPACPPHAPLTVHVQERSVPVHAICALRGGLRFDNASSLHVRWRCEHGCSRLATLKPFDWHSVPADITHSVHQLLPSGVEGLVTVRATLTHAAVSTELEAQLVVNLAQAIQVSPEEMFVYNHVDNRESVVLTGGSGYVSVHLVTESPVADRISVQHQTANHSLTVAPLAIGAATIQVFDLCLPNTPPAVVNVQVCSVVSVRLSVNRRLTVGSVGQALVQLLATGDRPLPARVASLVDLRLTPVTAGVLSVRPLGVGRCHSSGECLLFEVRAETVGDTQLLARVSTDSSDGVEHVQQVEVFPALQLVPANSTIPMDSQVQLVARGGPRGETALQFASEIAELVFVDSDGLVTGIREGSVEVTARVTSSDGSTVFSQASAVVRVARVCGVSVRAPLSQIERGNIQPVYTDAVDSSGRPFLVTVPLPDYLRVAWTTSSVQTAALSSPLQPLGVSDEGGVVKHLSAISAGDVQITAQLISSTVDRDDCPATVPTKSSIHVTIYEHPRLTNVAVSIDSIRMAPGSWLPLLTIPPLQSARAVDSLDKSLLNMDSSRRLWASDRSGSAMLQLMVGGEGPGASGPNRSVIVHVEVTAVQYVMARAVGATRLVTAATVAGVDHVPTGVKFAVEVSAHDWRGRTLHSWQSRDLSLSMLVGRPDLLAVSNARSVESTAATPADVVDVDGTDESRAVLALEMRRPGHATVTVRAGDHLVDTLFISASPLLRQTHTELVVGRAVCLSSQLLSPAAAADSPAVGRWSVHESAVARVDNSGVLVAVSAGSTTLSLHLSHDTVIHTPLNVLPIAQLKLSAPRRPSVSACSAQPYTLALTVLSRDESRRSGSPAESTGECLGRINDSSSPTVEAPVRCYLQLQHESDSPESSAVVSVDKLFSTHVQRSKHTGGFECVLTPLCLPVSSNVAHFTANLLVTAATTAVSESAGRDGHGHITSAPVLLKLVPPVSVQPLLSSPPPAAAAVVAVTPTAGQLHVQGTPDTLLGVSVEASGVRCAAVTVSKPLRVSDTLLSVTVSVSDQLPHYSDHQHLPGTGDTCQLIVVAPVTGQRVTVPLSASRAPSVTGTIPDSSDALVWQVALASCLGTLGVIFLLRLLTSSRGSTGVGPGPRPLLGPSPVHSSPVPYPSSPYSFANRSASSLNCSLNCSDDKLSDPPTLNSVPRLWTDDSNLRGSSPTLRRSPYAL